MTDLVKAVAIAATPGVVASILGVLNRWAVKDVHVAVNSRLDQLIDLTKQVAHAAGMKDAMDARNAIDAAKTKTTP